MTPVGSCSTCLCRLRNCLAYLWWTVLWRTAPFALQNSVLAKMCGDLGSPCSKMTVYICIILSISLRRDNWTDVAILSTDPASTFGSSAEQIVHSARLRQGLDVTRGFYMVLLRKALKVRKNQSTRKFIYDLS